MVEPVNRVAVKVANVVTEYAVDAFFANAGTSPKQVTDVAGTLVWSPHNMALQSQTFDQTTPWNPFATTTVTANAIAAPDATLTADRIVEVVASNNHQLTHANISVIVGATYTVSVYAKAGERNWLSICPTNTTPADWFDLTNGVVGTSANGGAISAAGDGWYRCSITYAAAGALSGPTFMIRTANGHVGVYAGDITKGIYLWGAQLVRGSVPTAYLPTTTAARYGLALDYDPVTHAARGLLCEPAATNLLLRSIGFGAANWTKSGATIGIDALAAPNGLMEADAFIPDAGTAAAFMNQSVTSVAATAYTYSVYVKNGTLGTNWFQLMVVSTTTWRAWFNLSTGAKGTSIGSPTSYNITSIGNGWYRVDVTITAGTTTANCYLIANNADGSTGTVTGNGTSPAFYAWGAQLETGAVATSPIPTFAATATRAADNYNFALSTIPALGAEYSLYAQFSAPIPNNTRYAVVLTDGTVNEQAGIKVNSVMQMGVVDGGSSQAAATFGTALTANVPAKGALRVQSNSFGGSANGSVPVVDTAGTVPTPTEVRFGGAGANAASVAAFHIWQFSIVPRAWTDIELQAKST